jgi:hypothetical protein
MLLPLSSSDASVMTSPGLGWMQLTTLHVLKINIIMFTAGFCHCLANCDVVMLNQQPIQLHTEPTCKTHLFLWFRCRLATPRWMPASGALSLTCWRRSRCCLLARWR